MLAEKPENDHTLAGGLDLDFRLCATLAAGHTGSFCVNRPARKGEPEARAQLIGRQASV